MTPAEAELVELKVRLALFAKEQRKVSNLSQDALAKIMYFETQVSKTFLTFFELVLMRRCEYLQA